MTGKQKIFADSYIRTLNATQSAKEAGYSDKSAYSTGHRLLKYDEIKNYIKKTMQEKNDSMIASQDELLRLLTSFTRDEKTNVKDRIKAAELLSKRYNLFADTDDEKIQRIMIVDDIEEDETEEELKDTTGKKEQ